MIRHALLGAFSLSSLALAAPHGARPVQPPPPVARVEVAAVRGDRFDLQQARQLSRSLDRAAATRDLRGIGQLDAQALSFIDFELREAAVETNQARRELRREGNRFDDRRDLRAEQRTRQQLLSLRSQLLGLSWRFDPRAVQGRRVIFGQLVQLAEADLRQAQLERREGRF